MKKTVILLSGHMQVGKNQLADYIQKELKYRKYKTTIDSFASGVKLGCLKDFSQLVCFLNDLSEEIKANIFSFVNDRDEIFKQSVLKAVNESIDKLKIRDENWFEKKTDLTRIILQLYGTNIFRDNVDENWWARQLQKRILESKSEFILITDTRFENEILTINDPKYEENYNTITVRVERNIQSKSAATKHESETALDKWTEWNYIVDNNGSLKDLQQASHNICNDILNESEETIGLFTRSSEDSLLLFSD